MGPRDPCECFRRRSCINPVAVAVPVARAITPSPLLVCRLLPAASITGPQEPPSLACNCVGPGVQCQHNRPLGFGERHCNMLSSHNFNHSCLSFTGNEGRLSCLEKGSHSVFLSPSLLPLFAGPGEGHPHQCSVHPFFRSAGIGEDSAFSVSLSLCLSSCTSHPLKSSGAAFIGSLCLLPLLNLDSVVDLGRVVKLQN